MAWIVNNRVFFLEIGPGVLHAQILVCSFAVTFWWKSCSFLLIKLGGRRAEQAYGVKHSFIHSEEACKRMESWQTGDFETFVLRLVWNMSSPPEAGVESDGFSDFLPEPFLQKKYSRYTVDISRWTNYKSNPERIFSSLPSMSMLWCCVLMWLFRVHSSWPCCHTITVLTLTLGAREFKVHVVLEKIWQHVHLL